MGQQDVCLLALQSLWAPLQWAHRQRDALEVDSPADLRLRDVTVQNYSQLMPCAPKHLCVSASGLRLLSPAIPGLSFQFYFNLYIFLFITCCFIDGQTGQTFHKFLVYYIFLTYISGILILELISPYDMLLSHKVLVHDKVMCILWV